MSGRDKREECRFLSKALLTAILDGGLMTPLRRDRPGPLIGRARHPLRTRRRMQASYKPKSRGAHTVAYHAHIFVGGPLQIHGYLGVPGSRMPVQPPDTRTSGSLPRARPRFDKSASRTACETTCEGYITLNPKVNMRRTHSGPCIMAPSKGRYAARCGAAPAHALALRPGMRGH